MAAAQLVVSDSSEHISEHTQQACGVCRPSAASGGEGGGRAWRCVFIVSLFSELIDKCVVTIYDEVIAEYASIAGPDKDTYCILLVLLSISTPISSLIEK